MSLHRLWDSARLVCEAGFWVLGGAAVLGPLVAWRSGCPWWCLLALLVWPAIKTHDWADAAEWRAGREDVE